jgi:type IV secretion system protein VirD4
MRAQSALLRLWIGSLLRAVVKGGLQESHKVHFILDEAASLGHMEALDDAVDKYRGYGVRLQLYYQSLGQLKLCWPEGREQTLLSNTTQVFFGVNDYQTAEYVSNRLGEETIIADSGGTSYSKSHSSEKNGEGSYSYSTSENYNWQQLGRKLLKPEEVATLNPRVAITFTPNAYPIWTIIVRYYEKGWDRPTGIDLVTMVKQAIAFFLLTLGMAAMFTDIFIGIF